MIADNIASLARSWDVNRANNKSPGEYRQESQEKATLIITF